MPTEEENIDIPVKQKQKKSLVKRILKWGIILFTCLILLLIGIFLFIQTDTFDKLALGYLLDKLNSSLEEKDSRINAAYLEGNLLKGLTLKEGNIIVKGDTMVMFKSLSVDYNIWDLLKNNITVDNIILLQPKIFFTKVRDKNDSLRWNIAYFLESKEKVEDTIKSVFDWDIAVDNFEIHDGALRILNEKSKNYYDKDFKMPKLDTFDLANFDAYNLDLKLNGNYFGDLKNIKISELKFKTNSDFNVHQFHIEANINENDTTVDIKHLNLLTDRTNLEIYNIFVQNLNPYKEFLYEDMKHKFVKVDLHTPQFNFKDLTFFLPDINFLDSTVALDLITEGEYGNLQINKLDLKTPNSFYSFSGNVKNLDEPSKLYFDVSGKNILIDPKDTKINLPGLSIPDYSHLGKVSIPYITYKGEPDRFISDFNVLTPAGNSSGNMFFDFTQNVARYKGEVSTTNLNVGKIVKDASLESSITGNFIVDASGFDYRTMTGKLNYSINRTKFYGQNISKSDGILNFNKGNVNLDINYNSDAVNTKLTGKVNITNLQNISYDLKGTASDLNIAAFTKDNAQKSNLNFNFEINGRGFNPDNVTGNFKINMNPSEFAEYKIPAAPLDIEIDQSGSIKKVSMKSDFVDFTAEGAIDINALGMVLNANLERIKNEFTQNNFSDSVQEKYLPEKTYSMICKNLNFKYTINVKNLEPLYSFTGNDTIKFRGDLTGNISDSCGIFAFTSNGMIRELEMKDSLLITDSAMIDMSIRNDLNSSGISKLDADIRLKTNNIVIKKMPFDTTQLKFSILNNKNDLILWTKRDSTIRLFTEASLGDSSIITFDSLSLRYNDFLVTNNNSLIVKANVIDSNFVLDFRQFTVNSMDQKLIVSGKYATEDSSDILISASNINLGYYQKMYFPDIDTANLLSGRIRYIDLSYKGTITNPDIKFSANSEILKIGSTKIGLLAASIEFKDDELSPNIIFYNEKNTGKFSLTGSIPSLTIPYTNFPSITREDSLIRAEKLKDKQAFLDIVADTFQLKVFQQLLPYTSGLEGILNGNIHLTGTPEQPQLTGDMDISKGKFYVTLTKMNYNFNAGLSTENEKLLIRNSRIFVEDEPSRFISTSGYIDFTQLTLNKIDLNMIGDVKVFDKDNGTTELGISGDLWAGSSSPGLHLTGSLNRFDLKGNLILVKGNVTFNPFIQEAYNIYGDDFNYGIIIDSIRSDSTNKKNIILQSPDSVVVLTGLNLNPFEKILYATRHDNIERKAKEKSGKFFYDLTIKTTGNVFLKFIVNEKSQQEFFGEIRTEDLNIYNYVNYQMQGRGTITLGDSYYKFFRKFDASGNVVFWGPITNPRLNIDAVYTGYSADASQSSGAQNIEDVTINMQVRGEAKNPVLTISLQRGGITETGSNATSDAISFLLFGKFKDQLSFGESSSFGANLGASFLSNYVSSSLEELFPFLINTNLNYVDSQSGTLAENTDIRFTAAVGDAVIKFGGQIFRGIANTDIVIDYPLNKLFKMKSLSNNLILRLEKIYDPFGDENNVTNTGGTKTGAILYYKIKF